MDGFKNFLLRGNLVEVAVAFIMATAFATVVTTFTDLVVALIALLFGGPPTVGAILIGGLNIAPFINAVIAFVIMGAIVYFGIVKPYTAFKERSGQADAEDELDDQTVLLGEIRDLLAGR